jgi:hypothetical protein
MCRQTVARPVCANCLPAALENEGDGVRPSHPIFFKGRRVSFHFSHQGVQVLGKASENSAESTPWVRRASVWGLDKSQEKLTLFRTKTQKPTTPKPADHLPTRGPCDRVQYADQRYESTRSVLYVSDYFPSSVYHASRRRTGFEVLCNSLPGTSARPQNQHASRSSHSRFKAIFAG